MSTCCLVEKPPEYLPILGKCQPLEGQEAISVSQVQRSVQRHNLQESLSKCPQPCFRVSSFFNQWPGLCITGSNSAPCLLLSCTCSLLQDGGGLFVSYWRVLHVLTHPLTFHKPPPTPQHPCGSHQYNNQPTPLSLGSVLGMLSNVGIIKGVRVLPSARMFPQVSTTLCQKPPMLHM